MPTPPVVTQMCHTFLNEVDAAAPGLVDGLYLCGSVALGDFHDTTSDVDFVTVVTDGVDDAGLAALTRAHHAVLERYPQSPFEGTHLTRAQLAADPADCPGAPSAHEGDLHRADRFALDPVTWHELAHAGIAVRGPAVAELKVWTDDAAFRAFTVHNLTSYWRPWRARYVSAAVEAYPLSAAEWAAAWSVLGVSRLHSELAGGGLTTKCGAGGHALRAFDADWHRLIVDCLGIRAGRPTGYADLTGLHSEVAAFLDMAIESALALA